MDAPRWLADEMLGRLARYLRFVGHDTAYVSGMVDQEIIDQVGREDRTLLTRDRALSTRVQPALLLTSPDVAKQFVAVARAWPGAGYEVRFDRCSLCNGRLRAWTPTAPGEWPPEMPDRLSDGSTRIYECPECGHRYWEGSHTSAIRASVARWLAA